MLRSTAYTWEENIVCGCRTKGCDKFSGLYALYKIRFVVVLFNSFRQQCADDSVGWLAN